METREFVVNRMYLNEVQEKVDPRKVVSSYHDPKFDTVTFEVPLDYAHVVEQIKHVRIVWPEPV